MCMDPSKVILCSPQIIVSSTNWIATCKYLYGDRAILYIHESQQDAFDPRKEPYAPRRMFPMPTFLCMEESDPELMPNVDTLLTNSAEQWVVILGRHTERLRALHRFLVDKN